MKNPLEKRKYPRVDTSQENLCRITVFGLSGRPVEGQILNLSLGGVAFISHWQKIAMAAKKLATKVRIQLPNGVFVDANTMRYLELNPSRLMISASVFIG